jgi:hypothetical protein
MSDVSERWHDWTYDGRGWYLVNDPEVTFYGEEEAMEYCDEHNRALVGQAALEERARIIGVINKRIAIHNGFINSCVEHDVRVSGSLFSALVELRCILREIEK